LFTSSTKIGQFNQPAISAQFASISSISINTSTLYVNGVSIDGSSSSADLTGIPTLTGNNYFIGNNYFKSVSITSTQNSVLSAGTGTTSFISVLSSGKIGILNSSPAAMLSIGTGSFVGDFTTPAIAIGTNNGIYVDSDRIFFKVQGNFGGGFASSQFQGNAIALNTDILADDLNEVKILPYRLTASGS